MKEELRAIPKKNYVILGVIIVVTLLLLYYFYMWFAVYNESKINKPLLNEYMDVINYNEIDNYLVENPNTIIYVSVLENKEIREFELGIKKSFKNHMIKKDILYLDLTDLFKDETSISDMEEKYSLNNLNIRDVPCLMVFGSGKLKSIYSIKNNGYDIDGLIDFINSVDSEIEDKLND